LAVVESSRFNYPDIAGFDPGAPGGGNAVGFGTDDDSNRRSPVSAGPTARFQRAIFLRKVCDGLRSSPV
jgi:hypothetical protein